jgi:hypothetical protein
MNLVRRFRPKASAGSWDTEAQRDIAAPYQWTGLSPGDAEMTEQFVSDMIVRECVLHCGGPWRGCGIPADELCLLAMQGANQRRTTESSTPGLRGLAPGLHAGAGGPDLVSGSA